MRSEWPFAINLLIYKIETHTLHSFPSVLPQNQENESDDTTPRLGSGLLTSSPGRQVSFDLFHKQVSREVIISFIFIFVRYKFGPCWLHLTFSYKVTFAIIVLYNDTLKRLVFGSDKLENSNDKIILTIVLFYLGL